MSCFDRAFQMLCTMQPKRKRKCMLQDALRCARRGRGREGDSIPLTSPWTKAPNSNAWFGCFTPACNIWIDMGERNHHETTDMPHNLHGRNVVVGRGWMHPLHARCITQSTSSHPGPPGIWEMERISYLTAGARGRKVGGLPSAF